MYQAKIVCDSISETGKRLTTFYVTIPENTYTPSTFEDILAYRSFSREWVRREGKVEILITATELDNFFKSINTKWANSEIRRIADLMYEEYHKYNNVPQQQDYSEGYYKTRELKVGEWHLPFVDFNSNSDDWIQIDNYLYKNIPNEPRVRIDNYSEKFIAIAKRISVARCARVSYLTHDGKRDIEKDLELFEKLRTSGHWSPFEHVATPSFAKFPEQISWGLGLFEGIELTNKFGNLRSGNFIGWKQYRKEFQDENCTHFRKEDQ